MELTRREFVKLSAAVAAATAAGVTAARRTGRAGSSGQQRGTLGQGCMPFLWHRLRRPGGHQGWPRGGHPRATRTPPVNKGLNCESRAISSPRSCTARTASPSLLRMKDGKFRQERRVRPHQLESGFRHHGGKNARPP